MNREITEERNYKKELSGNARNKTHEIRDEKIILGVPIVTQQKRIWLVSMRMQV